MAKKEIKTTTFIVKGKECVIREPDFQQLSFGLSAMTTLSGNLDMAGAGKTIFDVCKVKCDKEIEETAIHMLSLCLKIAEKYITPVEVEIKKN